MNSEVIEKSMKHQCTIKDKSITNQCKNHRQFDDLALRARRRSRRASVKPAIRGFESIIFDEKAIKLFSQLHLVACALIEFEGLADTRMSTLSI